MKYAPGEAVALVREVASTKEHVSKHRETQMCFKSAISKLSFCLFFPLKMTRKKAQNRQMYFRSHFDIKDQGKAIVSEVGGGETSTIDKFPSEIGQDLKEGDVEANLEKDISHEKNA